MRTITLELLRHGPAHNQLLSPLTPYLALCENHGAVTLRVPFEHNQFLYRLSSLTYKASDESRIFQLQDTARVMGEILASIPGLTAETNKEDQEGEHLTHLRLILSASELALLPFELALSLNGVPGSGQHLLLQPQMPICMTREIRRVPGEQFHWPEKPRILFAAAAPPEVGTIPLESHLLALRYLIAPWVKYYPTVPSDGVGRQEAEELRRQKVEEHLCFLPNASIKAIEDECASGSFTHVHILAHGVERKEGYDTRFFLALHDPYDPERVDYVSGSQLATALRATKRPDSRDLSRPAVVTLASCDSAGVGSVAGAGSSIAHALHEAGIPMVVAGQFPLSFAGSVRLVEVLYEGLLWGMDPRRLLFDLRRRLYSQFQNTHDWASLTAYVSLPDEFEEQLTSVQIEQAMSCINAAMDHADKVLSQLSDRIGTKGTKLQATPQEQPGLIRSVRSKIDGARKRLGRLLKDVSSQHARILGNLASTEKREAQLLHSALEKGFVPLADQEDVRAEAFELLRKSRDHYWETFQLDRGSTWALVQYISLTLVLQGSPKFRDLTLQSGVGGNAESLGKDLKALWSTARLLSLHDLSKSDRKIRAWAHSNLAELYLLSPLIERQAAPHIHSLALDHTDQLIETAGWDSFPVYSAWRQIVRYLDWFNKISNIGGLTTGPAEEIFSRFPEEIEEKWK